MFVDEGNMRGQIRANVPKAEAVLNICFAGSEMPKADSVSPQKWSRDDV